jgi:hypothetical protein
MTQGFRGFLQSLLTSAGIAPRVHHSFHSNFLPFIHRPTIARYMLTIAYAMHATGWEDSVDTVDCSVNGTDCGRIFGLSQRLLSAGMRRRVVW